ncbi:MAG: GNAT family N-acetyltransferase [Chloroflexi bacterium]|nr:GNAT family N-acetyltransferase [Chloroflexota bacterium]
MTEHGYVRDDRIKGEPHFWRLLDDVEQETPVAEIEIRSVAGEHEATPRTLVQRAAFATLDFEMPGLPDQADRLAVVMPDQAEIDHRTRIYRNVMKLPIYRQDLDIVAVTDDGEFAACCTCWLDSENNVAEFEPVGSLPSFRRRGIMRAVMNEGLRRLKAMGVKTAVVRTNPFNLPSIRLYESCGFELVFSDPVYRKTFAR